MKIWHNRTEIPTPQEYKGDYIYIFDDGGSIEKHISSYFYAGNLKKWARIDDIKKLEKQNQYLRQQLKIYKNMQKKY